MTTSHGTLLAILAISASFLMPTVSADPPWDEAGDVIWCADLASRTARDVLEQNLDYYGRTVTANYYGVKCKLRTHAPIVINGDPATTDRVELATKYGIIDGTGTAADPYMIQGWSIVRSQQVKVHVPTFDDPFIVGVPLPATQYTPVTDWGIQLLHVKKHYVIDGVHIEGYRCDDACDPDYIFGAARGAIKIAATPSWDYGVPNLQVTVRGSALIDNDRGVFATDAGVITCTQTCPPVGEVRVMDNTITAQGYGVQLLLRAHHATVVDNRVEPISIPRGPWAYGYMGIALVNVPSAYVESNAVDGTLQGVYLLGVRNAVGGGNSLCARIPFTDDGPSGPNDVRWTQPAGCTPV